MDIRKEKPIESPALNLSSANPLARKLDEKKCFHMPVIISRNLEINLDSLACIANCG